MYVFYDSNGVIQSIAVAHAPIDGYSPALPGLTELYLDDTEYADVAQLPLMYKIVSNAPIKQSQPVNAPTLAEAQAAKTIEIQQAYQNVLNAGFSSSASGTLYQYAYTQYNQIKLMKLAIDIAAGNVTFPVPIPAVDGTLTMYTQTQYAQFAKDISTFEWTLQNKLHDIIGPGGSISAATSLEQLNAIHW